jgi:hypothetical protein
VRVPHERPDEGGTRDSLPRVGDMPLAAFLPTDDTVLANAVRRAADAAERSKDNYAAHGSTP